MSIDPKHLSRAVLCPALALPLAAHAQDINGLVDVYKDLHSHPELSHHEERTSAIVAKALRADGYTVTEHVGKYPDGSQAFGVVGILKKGADTTCTPPSSSAQPRHSPKANPSGTAS